VNAPEKAATQGFEEYERLVTPERERLGTCWAVKTAFSPELPIKVFELSLLIGTAHSVPRTEPVEGWIRRAGERCQELGYEELGRMLVLHAQHEAGHHLMLINDLKALVAHWNSRHEPKLDAEQLLAQPTPPAIQRWQKLHEDTISGAAPFGQLAIEYEIEMLSVRQGTAYLRLCLQALGPAIASGLSFAKEHALLDVGHTELNAQSLRRFVARHPEHIPSLAECGRAALVSYSEHLSESLSTAMEMLGHEPAHARY
jgi:hypothetical protein